MGDAGFPGRHFELYTPPAPPTGRALLTFDFNPVMRASIITAVSTRFNTLVLGLEPSTDVAVRTDIPGAVGRLDASSIQAAGLAVQHYRLRSDSTPTAQAALIAMRAQLEHGSVLSAGAIQSDVRHLSQDLAQYNAVVGGTLQHPLLTLTAGTGYTTSFSEWLSGALHMYTLPELLATRELAQLAADTGFGVPRQVGFTEASASAYVMAAVTGILSVQGLAPMMIDLAQLILELMDSPSYRQREVFRTSNADFIVAARAVMASGFHPLVYDVAPRAACESFMLSRMRCIETALGISTINELVALLQGPVGDAFLEYCSLFLLPRGTHYAKYQVMARRLGWQTPAQGMLGASWTPGYIYTDGNTIFRIDIDKAAPASAINPWTALTLCPKATWADMWESRIQGGKRIRYQVDVANSHLVTGVEILPVLDRCYSGASISTAAPGPSSLRGITTIEHEALSVDRFERDLVIHDVKYGRRSVFPNSLQAIASAMDWTNSETAAHAAAGRLNHLGVYAVATGVWTPHPTLTHVERGTAAIAQASNNVVYVGHSPVRLLRYMPFQPDAAPSQHLIAATAKREPMARFPDSTRTWAALFLPMVGHLVGPLSLAATIERMKWRADVSKSDLLPTDGLAGIGSADLRDHVGAARTGVAELVRANKELSSELDAVKAAEATLKDDVAKAKAKAKDGDRRRREIGGDDD